MVQSMSSPRIWRFGNGGGKLKASHFGVGMRIRIGIFGIFSCSIFSGCGAVDAKLQDDGGIEIGSAQDLEEACEDNELAGEEVFEVVFSATSGGCDWDEQGNLPAQQGYLTARVEAEFSIELESDRIGCDMDFEFTDIDADYDPMMYYDDNFVFTFNDVVLASSYAPWIDEFEEEDGLSIYDWDAIVGSSVQFSGVPSYCLGQDDGLSECRIPPPETGGIMALEFDDSLDSALAYRALSDGEIRFMFAAMGDNDNSDCFHEDFVFEVTVPYVTTAD